jgi:hypothetical protein
VLLPVLALAHTSNIHEASHLNSIKTLNTVNTFKIKFKVHLNIEGTNVWGFSDQASLSWDLED